MKLDDFKALAVGDIVRCKRTKIMFVISEADDCRIVASRTAVMDKPANWALIQKAQKGIS